MEAGITALTVAWPAVKSLLPESLMIITNAHAAS